MISRQSDGLIKGRGRDGGHEADCNQCHQEIYPEKGYQAATVTITEAHDPAVQNSGNREILTFMIDKGLKPSRLKIIMIFGNQEIPSSKLKKQMKDTKEVSRLTLFLAPPI